MNHSFRARGSLAALAGLACQPALAAEAMDTLQVHGSISQAWLVSDDNDLFGSSSKGGGSYQYTELGANLSFRPHPGMLVATQVLSRRRSLRESGAFSEPPPTDYLCSARPSAPSISISARPSPTCSLACAICIATSRMSSPDSIGRRR